MQTIALVLILLGIVVTSGFIVRLLKKRIPLPLIQIVLGSIVASLTPLDVPLNPEIFFLLFIPPLLFLDGWRIPKGALFRDLQTIFALAVGLVIFTVIGMGYFIDWLIPTVPLAVAFALAAILSPTDPVAVSAIASTTPIPSRLMHILEGESLFNDASGLVCFRFAVAAALTGQFSFASASLHFVMMGLGGLGIGIAVSWVTGEVNKQLTRHVGEDPGVQILLSLLLPFFAYLIAEHLEFSGVLAAASAGIAMQYTELGTRALAATRMQRAAVWDTMQFALNGTIFVLLGLQLPPILGRAEAVAAGAGITGTWQLAEYTIAIFAALLALRFSWVWASLRLTSFRRPQRLAPPPRTFYRMLLVTTFSGVKGAITLAGILTLPLLLPGEVPFPARDLVIFLAVAVILLSLLSASVALPWLVRGVEFAPEAPPPHKEANARNAMAEAAIARLEQIRNQGAEAKNIAPETLSEAVMRNIDQYRRRLQEGVATLVQDQRNASLQMAEQTLRLKALHAERDELDRLRLSREIDDLLHERLLREIDLAETALLNRDL